MMRRHRGWLLVAALLLAGCEGYNLQLGTTASNLSGFHVVYEMPATSLRPWAERPAATVPPPPGDGSSGVSTLPASDAALPPERPPAAPAR
jgi:hypothetical protein